MSTSKAPAPARAALDLGDLEIKSSALPDSKQIKTIREVSEAAGFPSRTAPKPKPPKRKARTRPKTGRTYPFNTKIRPETYDMIAQLADAATEKEGRIVSMAEILERAIDRLVKE